MDRRGFLTGVGTAGAALLFGLPAEAQNWVLLGTRRVNWLADRDTVYVGQNRGTFRAIRLKVRGNDVYFFDLSIRYGNNTGGSFPIRAQIPQGGQTRVIDLAGNRRYIQSITMNYRRPINGRGTAYVEVWGRR